MPPPPVPDRSGLPSEPPSFGDQHTKISATSEFICPSKTPIEFPEFPSKISSPVLVTSADVACTLPCAPPPSAHFLSTAPPCNSTTPANFQFGSSSALFTAQPTGYLQIPVTSDNFGSIATPICDPLPQTIPMAPESVQLVFNSGRNFKSTAAVQDVNFTSIASPISGTSPAYFFNSSCVSDRPVVGRVLPPSILGTSPVIENAQFPSSSRFPAVNSVDFTPFPPGSSTIGPGSTFTVPSPSHGGAPIGKSTANSEKSTRSTQRVTSATPGISTGFSSPTVGIMPTVSFRDVLAPPSPRTAKNSFKDVLDSMDEMPEASFLDGKPGIRFSPEEKAKKVEKCIVKAVHSAQER